MHVFAHPDNVMLGPIGYICVHVVRVGHNFSVLCQH